MLYQLSLSTHSSFLNSPPLSYPTLWGGGHLLIQASSKATVVLCAVGLLISFISNYPVAGSMIVSALNSRLPLGVFTVHCPILGSKAQALPYPLEEVLARISLYCLCLFDILVHFPTCRPICSCLPDHTYAVRGVASIRVSPG
jgi:hypothetical protein